jgi:uncharacterized delta-60 repeat protein
MAYDTEGNAVGLYVMDDGDNINPIIQLTPDTTAGDALVATFSIPANSENGAQSWSLFDSDLNGVIDRATNITYHTIETDTHEYAITWSDATHWTARGVERLIFGTTYDSNGRPTSVLQDDTYRTITWHTSIIDNVVASATFTEDDGEAVVLNFIDSNTGDAYLFDKVTYQDENGSVYGDVNGWNTDGEHLISTKVVVQSSIWNDAIFSGTIIGTSSNPTTIDMTSYFAGSDINQYTDTPSTITINTSGSVNGTPLASENYYKFYSGTDIIAKGGDNGFCFNLTTDADNNPLTFNASWSYLDILGQSNETYSGVLTFKDTDISKVGLEQWSVKFNTLQTPLIPDGSDPDNLPDGFMAKNFDGHPVSVPLMWQEKDANNVIATFSVIVKDAQNNDVTFSGSLLDTNNDNLLDSMEGTWGTQSVDEIGIMIDTNTDGKLDMIQSLASMTLSGRVQVDASGNPAGLYLSNSNDSGRIIDFNGTPVGVPSSYAGFADFFLDTTKQSLPGYLASFVVVNSYGATETIFLSDGNNDTLPDTLTDNWTDPSGIARTMTASITWGDNGIFLAHPTTGATTESKEHYGQLAFDAQGDAVGLYFLTMNPVFTLIPDTTAGDELVATFTIPSEPGTWSLLDSDLNGVVDKMTRVQTYTDEDNVPQTDTDDYSLTWSDFTHWTARVTTVDLGFGPIFDNQGRPTTIPFYTHTATGPDVLHEIPLVWQTKGADNVVATANLSNGVSAKLLDTNGDNLPDQAIFTALSFASSIEGGPLYTTIANFTGWSSLSSTNTHLLVEVQTSTDPSLLFTGTITGTSSNPETIIMPSYFMGSNGNQTTGLVSTITINTTGSVNGTPLAGENYYRFSTGTGVLAQALGNNLRLDLTDDTDNNPATVHASWNWLNASGQISETGTGVLTFQDTDTSKAGPEQWSVTLDFNKENMPLIADGSDAGTAPDGFVVSDAKNNLVNVPLTWQERDANHVIATFTATLKNDQNLDVTLSGSLLDDDNDSLPDRAVGNDGFEPFEDTIRFVDTNNDGVFDNLQRYDVETLSGRVQVDASGNPAGLYLSNSNDSGRIIDFNGIPVGAPSRYESFVDFFFDTTKQSVSGYMGSALGEIFPPGVVHCFDEDYDGIADHFTQTWADATGTQSISGTTTWLDNDVFKSSGSALIGGIPYSISQYGRVAYDVQGDVVGLYFLTVNPVFTLIPDTTAGDELVATFTIPNQTGTWSLLDSDLNGVVDKMTRVESWVDSNNVQQTNTAAYAVTWSDATNWTAYMVEKLMFGSTYDSNGRPTTVMMNGAYRDIIWHTSIIDHLVATVSFTEADGDAVLVTFFDSNPIDSNLFHKVVYKDEKNEVHADLDGLNMDGDHLFSAKVVFQSSTWSEDIFSGTITGTSSNPTTIIMSSYFMESSGNNGTDATNPTVTTFSPADGATDVAVGSDIVLNFSEAIQKGTGSIKIHSGSATGAVVESFDAATSNRLSFTGSTVTINPTSDLAQSTHYFITISAGSIEDVAGNAFAGLNNATALDFATVVDNTAPTFMVGDGKITTDFGGDDYGSSVTMQRDGKILVAGEGGDDFAVVRYNSDGSLDTSFDTDGKVTTSVGSFNVSAYSVTVQSDGKILVAGCADADFALVRYNSDGSLDTSFDTDGKVTTDIDLGYGYVGYEYGYAEGESVTVQSDGKILVAGYTYTHIYTGSDDDTDISDFALARYNSDGSLDTSFDTDGKVTTDFGSGSDWGNSVTVQSDGKILVAGGSGDYIFYTIDGSRDKVGYTDDDFALVRYNSDGSLDTSFDTDGKVTTDFGSGSWGNSVTVQSDGKILVAGEGGDDFAVVRYNSDGSLDTSFDTDGKVTTSVGSFNVSAYSVTVQSDGKILVAGCADADFALVRYNSDGSLDTSFDTDGKVTTDIELDDDEGMSVVVQSDGKILVAGKADNGNDRDFAVARYNRDGSLDTTFDSNILNGTPTYTEGGSAVVLDNDVQIVDAELAALGNYGGATLTLARHGIASTDDYFSGAGIMSGTASGTVTVASTDVGHYTWVNGTLGLTFNTHATQALVNQAMQSLAYENASDAPPASVQIDWTFSDGNSVEALSAVGSTTVSITAVDDSADLHGHITFWKTGEAISDVTTTLSAMPIAGTQLVEFRDIHTNADGSHTVEIWATSSSDIASLQLEFMLSTGAVASWNSGDGLPAGWMSAVNTATGQFQLASITGAAELPAGTLKLGTLTVASPTNAEQVELLLNSGTLGNNAVATTGIVFDSTTTSNDGSYHYLDVHDGLYSLMAERVAGTAEHSAVTAADALAALKMAVGLNPNDADAAVSPYQYLAADVNHDGKVRANDALNILKMAVGLEIAPHDEWIFVPESVGSETMTRNHVDWSEANIAVDLYQNTELDLIGIVKGDVDGSWGTVG